MTPQEQYDELYAKHLAANKAIVDWTRHSKRLFDEAVQVAAYNPEVKYDTDALWWIPAKRAILQREDDLRTEKFLTFCQTGKYPE